jgi:hypothetical protein
MLLLLSQYKLFFARTLITSIPVIANFALVYFFIPYVLTYNGKNNFEHIVLIYSFFSAAGVLTLGVPVYLLKLWSLKTGQKKDILEYFFLPSAALFVYSLFLLPNVFEYFYLLLSIPILSYVIALRGVEEGKKNFLNSAMLRLIFMIILPLIFYFITLDSPDFGYVLSLLSLLFFTGFLFKKIKKNRCDFFNIRKKLQNIAPYAMQTLYIFLFIFLDRALLFLINPSIDFFIFTYEYEFIYRAIMPFTLILIILSPYMFEMDKGKHKLIVKGVSVLLILVFFVYSGLMLYIETIYNYLNLKVVSGLYQVNNFYMSTVITALCLGSFLQRRVITIKDEKYIFKVFLCLSIIVSFVGLYATFFFGSALEVLALKIIVEILILWYFLKSKVEDGLNE